MITAKFVSRTAAIIRGSFLSKLKILSESLSFVAFKCFGQGKIDKLSTRNRSVEPIAFVSGLSNPL